MNRIGSVRFDPGGYLPLTPLSPPVVFPSPSSFFLPPASPAGGGPQARGGGPPSACRRGGSSSRGTASRGSAHRARAGGGCTQEVRGGTRHRKVGTRDEEVRRQKYARVPARRLTVHLHAAWSLSDADDSPNSKSRSCVSCALSRRRRASRKRSDASNRNWPMRLRLR